MDHWGRIIRADIRQPDATDGARVHDLIADCPPLDTNSVYCNLLQCTHFAETSAVAEIGGDLVGAVIAYMPPEKPMTLFVWQVAVAEGARGQGLGLRMLKDILCRLSWWRLNCVQTTITEDNTASWALFESLARALNAPYEVEPLFDRDRHFAGAHPTEYQMTVAPLAATHLSSLRLKRRKVHVR